MAKQVNNNSSIRDKEFYMRQIDTICLMIKNRAEDILQDWNKGIGKIKITSEISPNNIPSVIVSKEYLPRGGEEISCLLNENLLENN